METTLGNSSVQDQSTRVAFPKTEDVESDLGAQAEPPPPVPRRELVCILFPGIVHDHERAIQCLGGIREISRVYSKPTTKRLGLTFSPENPFAKKTFGDLVPAPGLLLRVRVRKRSTPEGEQRELLSTTIVGEVNNTYKFESMLDFTLLPAPLVSAASPPPPPQCILHQLLPGGLDDLTWLRGPAPNFIVPAHFTRSDRPLDYRYSDKKHGVTRKLVDPDEDLHHKLRPERKDHYTHVMFNLVEELPAEPNPSAREYLQTRIAAVPAMQDELNIVQKMLEERPIWSKSALQYHTKLSSQSLKTILPTLGFYYRGGPWRHMWVRFHYDPRKDPKARLYQTLDFRLRNIVGVNAFITPRGPHFHKKVARVRPQERRNPFSDQFSTGDVPESAVLFREGLVPCQRQIYYQYCDLKVAEVEELLARAGEEVPPGVLCHARRGWLPPGLDTNIREILLSITRRTVLEKVKEGAQPLQEGSSGSEEDGDAAEQREWAEGEGEEFILPDMQE